jgi:DNA modification methylase
MGDSYGSKGGQGPQSGEQFAGRRRQNEHITTGARFVGGDIKEKDLMGIPWLLAFALRADGWFLRQEIIWHKPNPMPESVTDRCTRAHEHIFLLSKSPRYFFDAEAISEAASPNTNARQAKDASTARAVPKSAPEGVGIKSNGSFYAATAGHVERRNKRSVWTVGSEPFPEAHFATFPPALVEPCILAGSPSGGFVLDPFGGAGTTGLVAARLGRSCTLIELNPKYARITERRLRAGLAQVEGPPVMDDDLPLFAGEAA